jgi:hypothetical protein
MVEKRSFPRHRMLKAGTIEFGHGAIDCMVRNISSTAPSLDVASPVGIPTKFTLIVLGDGLHFACRVSWRKGQRRLGVAFD